MSFFKDFFRPIWNAKAFSVFWAPEGGVRLKPSVVFDPAGNSRAFGQVLGSLSELICPIPDVCIDQRRLPLFIARATLRELIAGLQARATGETAR